MFMAFVAVLAILPLSNVKAQNWGVGLVGGFDYGVQVKKYMGGNALDFRGHLHNHGFQVAGLYEWNHNLGSNFTLYYGVGAGLGTWKVTPDHDMGFGLDIEAIVGVEWQIPGVPLACLWITDLRLKSFHQQLSTQKVSHSELNTYSKNR